MAGFVSYDDLITQITTNSQYDEFFSYKISGAPILAGVWHTTWLDSGFTGAGSAPATTPGTAYDGSGTHNNGGVTFANVSPANRYLLTFGAVSTTAINIMLVDRLVAVSGLSVASTGNKTVSSTTLPRYTTGVGVQPWLEVTTAFTTTVPIITLNSYTNQAGATGHTGTATVAPSSTTKIGDMFPLTVAAGDTGIQAVSTISVGTAASAGAVNLVLLKPLAYLNLAAETWNEKDFVLQLPSMPQLFDTHCLHVIWQSTGVAAPTIWWNIRTSYK